MAAAMIINSSVISTAFADDLTKYELEDAVFTGTIETEADSNASGGKVAYMKEDGTISVDVEAPTAGMYTITIYAQGVGSAKQQELSVNGVSQGAIGIPLSDAYEPVSMTVKLDRGVNTVSIEKSWGWSKFDYLTVASAELAAIKATQTTTCDILATDETRALMSYLAEVYGNNIISGQQEIYSGGPHDLEYEFEYLNDLTGHYPAIRGFDYGNFCCPAFGSDDGSTNRVIEWVKNRNGIATASFHLNVPKDFASYNIGDRIDWAQTTYGNSDTDFSPENAAIEGTKENEYYMQALTTLAAEFKKLEAEGVPVIWRPLHEAEGGGGELGSWFWWGREGSEVYKKLWIYTYKTLTEKFECHNLIWEWNSYNFATSADWYPGDEYVDIIGYDKYSCSDWTTGTEQLVHNDSAVSATFYGIMEKYDSAKMIAMAENDSFSTVENLTMEKAGWLYFCTWYDGKPDGHNFVTDPIFNTKEDTVAMYQSEYCITLDELPTDLYTKYVEPVDPALTTTKPTTTAPTTTTRASTEADPNKNYGKVVYDKLTGNYKITLPEAKDEFYVIVELPEKIEYANGGLGVSVPLDDVYYWVNLQWETTASGSVKINVADNFYNCSLGTDVIEDEELIEKIRAELGKGTTYEGQIWYAQSGGKAASTDGISFIDAYVMKDNDSTTTVVPTDETSISGVEVTLLGDANCDGKVSIADSTSILQHIGNSDKYSLTPQGEANADCYNPGSGITGLDAIAIQKIDAKIISSLPELGD